MSRSHAPRQIMEDSKKIISSQGIFDVEIHAEVNGKVMLSHLPERYRERTVEGILPHGMMNFDQRGGGNRRDIERGAAGNPERIKHDLLDRYGITKVILTGTHYDNSIYSDIDYWSALASAFNTALIEEFVPQNDAFYGTIRLNMNDPDRAVAEIERWADHPRVAGIMTSAASIMTPGSRNYDRIFAAAADANMVISYHTTQEGRALCPPPTSAGYPSRYIEYHSALATSAIGHLASMITNGVFERHPQLKILYLEGGISWALPLLWQLDADWEKFRNEVPYLKKKPSEYFPNNVYFTTQPIEEPTNGRDLLMVYEELGLGKNIVYSTDYPHWDFDPPDRFLPSCFSQEQCERILWNNARELYSNRIP